MGMAAGPEAKGFAIRSTAGRGWKRGCLTATLAVLGVLLLAAGGWAWHIKRQAAELREHADALLAEWQASRPQPSPEDDAAPLYRQAFEGLPNRKALAALFASSTQKPSPEARRLVSESGECLRLAEEARAKPACLFRPGRLDVSLEELAPPILELLDIVRLTSLRAMCREEDGDAAGALSDALGILRTAEHLAQDRSLIADMVGTACIEPALARLQAMAAGGKLDERQLARAIAEIDAHLRRVKGPAEALRGEKAVTVSGMARIAAGLPLLQDTIPGVKPAKRGGPDYWAWRWSGLAFKDVRNLEAGIDRLIAAMDLPAAERLAALDAFRAELEAAPRGPGSVLEGTLLSGTILPAMTAAVGGFHEGRSKLLVCRTALACCLYRLRRGAYPETIEKLAAELPELAGAVPEDPYRPGTLSYRKTGDGFKVWAVSRDSKDDGGQAPQDDVFEVGR